MNWLKVITSDLVCFFTPSWGLTRIRLLFFEDVPPRVMEMLRMFLAANSRGEVAVLHLETRKNTLTTNYKNEVRTEMTGTPAKSTDIRKKKQNPSRARRSLLRLKKFMQMKEEAKLEQSEVNLGP